MRNLNTMLPKLQYLNKNQSSLQSLQQNQSNLLLLNKNQSQKELMQWVAEDTLARGRYLGVLDSLQHFYTDNYETLYGRNLWIESFYNGSDIFSFVVKNLMRSSEDDFQERVAKQYRDIDVATDKKVFLALLQNYLQHIPGERFRLKEITQTVDSLYQGNYARYADDLYARL